MIVLYNDTQVRISWEQCPGTEPMDLLFRRHHTSESEPGMPAPLINAYAGRDNKETPTLPPVTSRRISSRLTVMMAATVASQNPLPQ